MSSYEDRFVKTGVAFHTPYCKNEYSDLPPFFCISDIGNLLSACSKSMKQIRVEDDFHANVVNWCLIPFVISRKNQVNSSEFWKILSATINETGGKTIAFSWEYQARMMVKTIATLVSRRRLSQIFLG